MSKAVKYLWNALHDGCFVRAWNEGRGRQKETMVQVWVSGKADGEPDGDWALPGCLPLDACIDQAILNTRHDLKQSGKATV